MRHLLFSLLLLLASTALLPAGDSRPLTIAVIPKGTTHEFWKAIHAGAQAAARTLTASGQSVRIIWKGPLKEDDRAAQIEVVQGFVGQVDGMVLAPLDKTALARPVADAVAAKCPVVVIDSALDGTAHSAFVATDNRAGGAMAGRHLAGLLGGKGRVLVLRYQQGSASTEEREAGFLAAISASAGITVVDSTQYAGPTRESALTASQNLLGRFQGRFDAVFTPNESSTAGMNLALKELGLASSVIHIGFDASAPLVAAMRAGEIKALVVQDPYRMGYLGVATLADVLNGRPVTAHLATPLGLVTPANLDSAETRALLDPAKP